MSARENPIEMRRRRRAFRYIVLGAAAITFSLWYLDNYSRYDLLETQYRSALTLERDSARAILRNVVRVDRERREAPVARYVEALAEIEPTDGILPRYDEAYTLDPQNADLVLRYGVELFQAGQFLDARERFREASVLPPPNALPTYLEAAALALSMGPEGSYEDVFTAIARANSAGNPVQLPKPLWHPSLPESGEWYASRRREVQDRCFAPLYRGLAEIPRVADADLQTGNWADWYSWLDIVAGMGQRLSGAQQAPYGLAGTPALVLGTQVEREALRMRSDIRERFGLDAVPEEAARLDVLAEVQAALQRFEAQRERIENAHRTRMAYSGTLWRAGLVGAIGIYIVLSGLGRFRSVPASPSPPSGSRMVGGLFALLAGLYAVLTVRTTLSVASLETTFAIQACTGVAFACLAALFLGGAFYPRAVLRAHSPAENAADAPAPPRPLHLMRRYFGLLAGGLFVGMCGWFLTMRLLTGLYPSQTKLLTTGLLEQEQALAQNLLEMLAVAQGGAGG